MASNPANDPVVATNRQARRDYDILETLETGMVLRGSEVKSLRNSNVTLREAYARIIDGELWLIGLHIAPYAHAAPHTGHAVDRDRKLLARRDELDTWAARLDQEHLTLVPLQLYFLGGRAKLQIGLARGRKQHDKRQLIARRDAEMEARRAMARANRRG